MSKSFCKYVVLLMNDGKLFQCGSALYILPGNADQFFFVNLLQDGVLWEAGTSIEKMLPSTSLVGVQAYGTFFMIDD